MCVLLPVPVFFDADVTRPGNTYFARLIRCQETSRPQVAK